MSGSFFLAAFLFLLGLYTLATKRNLLKNLIGMSISFSGINLSFVQFSALTGNLLGHAIVVNLLVLEGCVLAITLAYVYSVYKRIGSLDLNRLRA
jgi:NADH:ubiquinone oxidoreductase subunit K